MTEQVFDAAAIQQVAAGEPEWFADARIEALARFDALDLPDPGSEEWRYTDLTGFSFEGLSRAPAHRHVENLDGVPDDVLAAIGEVGERDGIAIQIDGDVVHRTLDAKAIRAGVIFCDLAIAARDHRGLLEDVLGAAGFPDSEAKFTSLATAMATGGTFLYVPRGAAVIVGSFRWLETENSLQASRTVIIAEESSDVTFVEHSASPHHGSGSLSLSLAEIYARPASNVSYINVQDHADDVWNFHVQRAIVQRDATLRNLAATLGAKMSRSVVETMLAEQGASAKMLGVYFADGEQHFDHRSLQEHAAPNTTSELVYKGALKDSSKAVYTGSIHIAKDARRSNAEQTNRNLILSEHAKADSIPYLEIENNDVRCAHAASVGPPDDNQVFYLRSRGLPEREAEELIVRGYFQEVLDRVSVREVRETLERAVEKELAQR